MLTGPHWWPNWLNLNFGQPKMLANFLALKGKTPIHGQGGRAETLPLTLLVAIQRDPRDWPLHVAPLSGLS